MENKREQQMDGIRQKADFKQIASEYGIDQVLARIIRNRDICGSKDIDMYLNGNLNDIHNPHSMKDADKFVDIITKKIEEHKPVRIIGDYDIDGICSIYILFCGLKAAGADVDYVVPHRINDGYGINEHLIDNAINEGIDTIVTCDNGIAAYNQVRYAKDNGITMIVTDHHDVPFEIKDDKRYTLYLRQMQLLTLNRQIVIIHLSCYVEQALHISL